MDFPPYLILCFPTPYGVLENRRRAIVDDRGKRAKIKDNRFQISLPAIDVMGNYYS
jgi:hypothetical protein